MPVLNIQVPVSNVQVGVLNIQMPLLNIQVPVLNMQVPVLNIQVSVLSIQVLSLSIQMSMLIIHQAYIPLLASGVLSCSTTYWYVHAVNRCPYDFLHVVYQSLILSDFGKLTSMTVFIQSNELEC